MAAGTLLSILIAPVRTSQGRRRIWRRSASDTCASRMGGTSTCRSRPSTTVH